jgi:hypothetical protein
MRYLLLLLLAVSLCAQGPGTCPGIPLGFNLGANGGSLNGFVPFPSSTYWHRDISNATTFTPDANSHTWQDDIMAGINRYIQMSWPATQPEAYGAIEGYHYHVVPGSQPRVNVLYDLPFLVGSFTNGSTSVSWVRGGGEPTQYFDDLVHNYFTGQGTVSATNGSTAVTYVGGNGFSSTWAGQIINLDNVGYSIASATSTTMVLASSYAGTTGNHTYYYTPIPVSGMVGNYFDGPATAYSFGLNGCSSACTTATLNTAYAGPTGNHGVLSVSIPSQSEPGPQPIPLTPMIQASIAPGNQFPNYDISRLTDGHLIVIDRDNCVLYENYAVDYDGHNIHAGGSAVFDLLGGDLQRPLMWTSGSVSGMPMFPGLVRDEELNGTVPINHPVIVNLSPAIDHCDFIFPAEHHQYGCNSTSRLPIGSLLRLNASFDLTGQNAIQLRIATAFKKYGLIYSDGGTSVSAYTASGWNWDSVFAGWLVSQTSGQLVPGDMAMASDGQTTQPTPLYTFEVITSGLTRYCDGAYAPYGFCTDVGTLTGSIPNISAFTANGSNPLTVSAGTPVTLAWTQTGASTPLAFINPYIGTIRGASAPPFVMRKTTTFTIQVENMYGPRTATVTVTVI